MPGWAIGLSIAGYVVVGFFLTLVVVALDDSVTPGAKNDPSTPFAMILWPVTVPLIFLRYYQNLKKQIEKGQRDKDEDN